MAAFDTAVIEAGVLVPVGSRHGKVDDSFFWRAPPLPDVSVVAAAAGTHSRAYGYWFSLYLDTSETTLSRTAVAEWVRQHLGAFAQTLEVEFVVEELFRPPNDGCWWIRAYVVKAATVEELAFNGYWAEVAGVKIRGTNPTRTHDVDRLEEELASALCGDDVRDPSELLEWELTRRGLRWHAWNTFGTFPGLRVIDADML